MIKDSDKNIYITKDSGIRMTYKSGLARDIEEGKPRYDLIYVPFLDDWANLMARGAAKYGEKNWMNANSIPELDRFKASAWRHFMAFMKGENDEAHHVAIAFNIAAIQYLMNKLKVDIKGNKL